MIVIHTVVAATLIGILIVIVTIAVAVGMTAIGTGTPMDATVVTGVTAAVQRLAVAADDTLPTTDVARVTREALHGEAALLEAADGTMRVRPGLLHQRLIRLMFLGGEHCHHYAWAKSKMPFKCFKMFQQSSPQDPSSSFSKIFVILSMKKASSPNSFNSTKIIKLSSSLTISVSTSEFLFLIVIALQ